MNLSDIVNHCMVRSGNYILGNLSATNTTMAQIWYVLKPALYNYGKYVPVIKKFAINMSTDRFYNFTGDSHGIPEWVVSVIPTSLGSALPVFPVSYYLPITETFLSEDRVVNPRKFLKMYRKPNLWTTELGIFDIEAQYAYAYTEEFDSSDPPNLTDVVMPDLEDDANLFLDIAHGEFLQIIGRSRRIFEDPALQVLTDAPTMVNDGMKIKDQAMETLYSRQKWWDVSP